MSYHLHTLSSTTEAEQFKQLNVFDSAYAKRAEALIPSKDRINDFGLATQELAVLGMFAKLELVHGVSLGQAFDGGFPSEDRNPLRGS